MRLFAIVLLCLVLATCASHIPSARVTHPASAGLPGLQGFQLMPPEQAVDALPYRNRYPLINAELRQGLAAHGYHESATPAFRVYYWRGSASRRTAPLRVPPDLPAHIHGALSGDPPPARQNRDIARTSSPGGARSLGRYGKHRPQPGQSRNSSNWRSAPCSGNFHAPAGRLEYDYAYHAEDSMQIYKVGGAVRDRLLGRPVTDIDWVVVGASSDEMLARGYRPVGADFPVFLHPRRRRGIRPGAHRAKERARLRRAPLPATSRVTLEEDLTRRRTDHQRHGRGRTGPGNAFWRPGRPRALLLRFPGVRRGSPAGPCA